MKKDYKKYGLLNKVLKEYWIDIRKAFIMLTITLLTACNPFRSIIGNWRAVEGNGTLKVFSNGEFIMEFTGKPPDLILTVEEEAKIESVKLVDWEITYVPLYTPLEKDEAGNNYLGKPIGNVKIKGICRPFSRYKFMAFSRVITPDKEYEEILFFLERKGRSLYLQPKALLLNFSEWRR